MGIDINYLQIFIGLCSLLLNIKIVNPIKLFNDAFIRDESGWVSTEDIKKALIKAKLNDVKLSQFLKDRGFVQKRGSLILICAASSFLVEQCFRIDARTVVYCIHSV
jgi:hypothetical protein